MLYKYKNLYQDYFARKFNNTIFWSVNKNVTNSKYYEVLI